MSIQEIESLFPKLRVDGYIHTSDDSTDYNCFAWALNDKTDWYSHLPIRGYYWPPENEVPRDRRLTTLVKLFRREGGFVPCANGRLEKGYEKIALYMNVHKEVTHAARQLLSDEWTSKLGILDDITHPKLATLEDAGIQDEDYGTVIQFLKRKIL